MKNLLFTAAFILSIVIQLQASNTPQTSSLIVVQNEKSIILNTPSQTSGSEVLTIMDSSGEIIFSDVIESNKKRVKYDLRALLNANYTISVVDNEITNVYETEINDDKIEIVNTKSYYRPTIENLDGKTIVSADLENKENILVSIYDKYNVLVFQQNTEHEHSFIQSFNLNQLPKGQYEVIVSTQYFKESIKVIL